MRQLKGEGHGGSVDRMIFSMKSQINMLWVFFVCFFFTFKLSFGKNLHALLFKNEF